MTGRPKSTFNLLLSAVLAIQLAGCGTLMHPDRKGQRDGDIDVGVAILDGLGLLFFIIPGVIAYAVDFSNGTIYLPPRHRVAPREASELRQIHFDPARSRMEDVEARIEQETGLNIKLDRSGAQVFKLASLDEMMMRFGADEVGQFASR